MRIIDSHVHLKHHQPEKLMALADHYRYDKLAVMAIPCHSNYGILNGLECLLMKRLAPGRVYAYSSVAYPAGLTATAKSHEKQLEMLMEAGFDGWKILESKPNLYRELQQPLDSEVFSRAFALAESENIPVTWHAGDPATFWDAEKAPEFAARNGWLYLEDSFPTLKQLYAQVENVLARHPKLGVSMAHLYFTSDDRAHGERLLDTYENFRLDITPGSEMYYAFLEDREGWKAFFEKYQDRLVYGTDMIDSQKDIVFDDHDDMFNFTFRTLAADEPVNVMGADGCGLGLSGQALDKIFATNFERIAGTAPKPVSESGLNAYAEWLMPHLTPEERRTAEDLLRG